MADEDAKAFICPITNGIFEDPVKAEDGKTYDRQGMEQWFASCRQRNRPITSPWTRQPMGTRLVEDWTAAEGAKRLRFRLGNPSWGLDIRSSLENIPSVHDLHKVFATLDPLRSILEKSLDGWQLPQIVVIGQESSGKSTLLERLAMMPIFPRNETLCTRLPIHVRLRNAERCKAATLEVYNVRTRMSEEGPYVIPTEYGAVDVRDKMQEIIVKEHGMIDGGVSSERIIILTISSPYVPSIDLVDLPGLVQVPERMKESTSKIVEEHIEKHGRYSVFLATVSASEAPNVNAGIHIVQSKKLQDRTIGVFTMCDEVVPIERKKKLLMERVKNGPGGGCSAEALEPHGWVCMMNKEMDVGGGCSNFSRLKAQALAEEAFMREHMGGVFEEGKGGCGALMERLMRVVMRFVGRTWAPKTVQLLDEALQETMFKNATLGMPAMKNGGMQEAAEARLRAASEAKRRMEGGKKELVQGCCREVLRGLKSRLTGIVCNELVKVDASEFVERWKGQRERFEKACMDGVDEWVEYWRGGVRGVLKRRDVRAATRAAKKHVVDNPVFELDRFPRFVSAVEERVDGMLRAAKARIVEGISVVADKYYGIMSPWVTLQTDLDDVASVSIRCNHSAVVENAMVCFIKEGVGCIFGELCSEFSVICGQVADCEWIESCAKEREELLLHIKTLEQAKREFLALFEGQSLQELLQHLDHGVGVVDGDCKYIRGCNSPEGIAVDAEGHVYVAECVNNVVKVFSGAGRNGTFVREFGRGYLNNPMGLAIDGEGAVYVGNSGTNNICIFDSDGKFKRYLGDGNPSNAARLGDCRGITVDREGNVYVCNHTGHTVNVWDKEGKFARQIGSGEAGTAPGQLHVPCGVAVDDEGNVYVACNGVWYLANGQCISVFNKDGVYVKQIGTAEASIADPCGVAVDREGNVYVAGYQANLVGVFNKQGEYIKKVHAKNPYYVAVDANGQLLISEYARHQIRVVRR